MAAPKKKRSLAIVRTRRFVQSKEKMKMYSKSFYCNSCHHWRITKMCSKSGCPTNGLLS